MKNTNFRSNFEDHYATAQEYLTSDDESDDGFVNIADSDTEQPRKVPDKDKSNTELQHIYRNTWKISQKTVCLFHHKRNAASS